MRPREFPCEACADVTPWLRASEAARKAGVSRRTIYNWIEREKIHTRNLPGGVWLVCWCSVCGEREGAQVGRGCPRRFLCKIRKTGELWPIDRVEEAIEVSDVKREARPWRARR